MSGTPEKTGRLKRWATRFGIGAFWFFLIKGLLWLAVFYTASQTLR